VYNNNATDAGTVVIAKELIQPGVEEIIVRNHGCILMKINFVDFKEEFKTVNDLFNAILLHRFGVF